MLDIDLVTILAEIVNFLVLAVALYYLLFKPTVKRMEETAKKRAELLIATEENDRLASENLKIIESRLANIDNEIEERIQMAQQRIQSESEMLLDATQQQAQELLLEAKNEVEKFQQQEIEVFHNDLVQSILKISSEVLHRSTPSIVHDNLVDELVQEIWELGKSDIRQVKTIRDSLAERVPTVNVVSAKELSQDQQRSLMRTFGALADRNIHMEIEIEPELISGLTVRIGDLIVENSLAMELNQLKAEVSDSLVESIRDEN